MLIGRYDKVTFLRTVEFEPVWDESRKKYQDQAFDPSFDNLSAGFGICYTKETYIADVGAYQRLDYIPLFPIMKDPPAPSSSPFDVPRAGWNGALRVILSMSDTKSCPPLQRDSCAEEVPFDGKPLEDDDLLIRYI